MFNRNKNKETWLTVLEDYVNSRNNLLLMEKGFERISAQDGPGMGALITFSNKIIEFDLINDKSQYFIDVRSAKYPDKSYSQAFLIAISKLLKANKSFTQLSEKEKISLYEIVYDYSDPFKFFFLNYDDILFVLDENNFDNSMKELESFLDERVKWLFPKLYYKDSSKP